MVWSLNSDANVIAKLGQHEIATFAIRDADKYGYTVSAISMNVA